MTFVAVSVAAAMVAGVGIAGCASRTPPTELAPKPTAPAIEAMAFEDKQTALPAEFPVEMPVPEGKITTAQQQGSDAWVYEIDIAAPLDDVAAWYEQALSAANWTVAERSGSRTPARLVFAKGDAQTEVILTEGAPATHAVVSVGVGVPVGQTY